MVAAENRPEQLGKGETGRAMRLMTGKFTKNMVSSTERVLFLSKQQAGRAGGSVYSLCAASPEKTIWRYTLYRQRQQTGCCCPLNDKLTLVCKNDVPLSLSTKQSPPFGYALSALGFGDGAVLASYLIAVLALRDPPPVASRPI